MSGAGSWIRGLTPSRAAFLLCGLTAAAYAGVVQAGFVWDDGAMVLANSLTADLGSWPRFFTSDLWEGTRTHIGDGSGYYRPLMLLSLALDRALFGLEPGPAHLHNLAWHLVAVLGLHRLLLRWLPLVPSTVGAAIFALHPLQSEAVVWVSARNDLMAAALVLWALVALHPPRPGPARLLGGGVLALAAVLSKESALLAPAMLLVLDVATWGRPVGPWRHGVLWGAAAAHLLMRTAAGVASAALPQPIGWRLLWVRVLDVPATYGALLAWPWPLSGGRDLESLLVPTLPRILGLVALALLAAAVLLPPRHRIKAAAGLLLAAASFAPSVLALADKGLLGERYLYLSMAGIGMAVAAATPDRPLSLGALGLWALPWLGILHLRIPEWSNDVTLWRAAWRDTPSTYVEVSLANALRRDNQNLEAALHFRRAVEGVPPQLEYCPNVVGAALEAGRLDLALEGARSVADRGCDSPAFQGYHAVALAMSGRWPEAVPLALKAREDPSGRARLVTAAWSVVTGSCAEYEDLMSRKSSAGLTEQVARILAQGGYGDLALELGRSRCPRPGTTP